jgi:hypothetical protein
MGFMAVGASKFCLFEVQFMLAYLCLAAVAGAEAVFALHGQRLMGVVAVMAFKPRHYADPRYIGMAGEAPLRRGHPTLCLGEIMAIQTEEAGCPHAVDEFVHMALLAIHGVHPEIVHAS